MKLCQWWREERESEGEWIKGGREEGRNTQRKEDRERAQGILSTHMFRLIISLMIIALSLSHSKSVWVSSSLTVCVTIVLCVSIFLFSWITFFLHLSIPIYWSFILFSSTIFLLSFICSHWVLALHRSYLWNEEVLDISMIFHESYIPKDLRSSHSCSLSTERKKN